MSNIPLEKLINFIESRSNLDKFNKECLLKKNDIEYSKNFSPLFKSLFPNNSYRLGVDSINDSFFYSFIKILNINTFDSNTIISLKSNLFNCLINERLYYDYNYKDEKYTIKKFKDYLLTEKNDYFEGCIQLVVDYFKINIAIASLVNDEITFFCCSKTKQVDFFKPTICMFLNYNHFEPLLIKNSTKNYFDNNDEFISKLKQLIGSKNDKILFKNNNEFTQININNIYQLVNNINDKDPVIINHHSDKDIDNMTVSDLHKIAKKMGISIYKDGKKKVKKDLISDIKNKS